LLQDDVKNSSKKRTNAIRPFKRHLVRTNKKRIKTPEMFYEVFHKSIY